MMLNSLSFCLSVKLLICPSYLNEILAGYSNLGCRFLCPLLWEMVIEDLALTCVIKCSAYVFL